MSRNSLFIWHGITKAWKCLVDGFEWKLGSGQSSLQYDVWSPLGKLCERVPFVHISDTHLRVRDACVHGVWNFNLLYIHIPADLEHAILKWDPPQGARDDGWVWKGDASALYSASSGYHWLMNFASIPADAISWSWLWRLHAPEKIMLDLKSLDLESSLIKACNEDKSFEQD